MITRELAAALTAWTTLAGLFANANDYAPASETARMLQIMMSQANKRVDELKALLEAEKSREQEAA